MFFFQLPVAARHGGGQSTPMDKMFIHREHTCCKDVIVVLLAYR